MTDNSNWQRGLHEASPYLTIGIQLAGSMLVYIGIGYLLDRWLDTAPTFLIVGSIVGMIAFFILLIRITKQMSARDSHRHSGDSDAKSSDE